MSDQKRLSVVTTLYHSESTVREFYERVSSVARNLTEDYEIVFVNDGSPDKAIEIALDLVRTDHHIKVVDLSRNFGHHKAIMAGLANAVGELVFLIDVDLEEEPEWLPRFMRELETSGGDVVYGVQATRSGSVLNVLSGKIFYSLFNAISEVPIAEDVCTVRLMTRRYRDALLELQDRNPFLAGNFAWTGFAQKAVPVEKKSSGRTSSYTLGRRVRLFVNAITSFSAAPLRIVFGVGFFIAVSAALFGAGIVVRKILDPDMLLLGWPSVMVSIWFLGGVIILLSGLLGMYIAMVYDETKNRPQYIVRRVVTQASLATDRTTAEDQT